MTDVLEICGLSRSEIFESQGREMIDVRGKLLPLYRLDELFNWNDYLPRPTRPRESGRQGRRSDRPDSARGSGCPDGDGVAVRGNGDRGS